MILAITIKEMQLLNTACKRVLGDEEWTRRTEVAWESLRGLEFVTADMLESAIMDGFDQDGVHFDRRKPRSCASWPRTACGDLWVRTTRRS